MFSLGILLMYLIWIGFIAIVLYGLYKVLSALLDRYLEAKRDHTAALREQNTVLKEIAAVSRMEKIVAPLLRSVSNSGTLYKHNFKQ